MALLEFYGEECPHCVRLEPLLARLEKEGHVIERHETWHNDDNKLLMLDYDKGLCGGVPFLFNTDSKKFICVEADYEALKAWAEGK